MLRFIAKLILLSVLVEPGLFLPNPKVQYINYDTWFNNSINYDTTYILGLSSTNHSIQRSSRIYIESLNSDAEAPLMIVVQQRKEVLSWQLPLPVLSSFGKLYFNSSARTLCPTCFSHNLRSNSGNNSDDSELPIISLSTFSKTSIAFNLIVYHEDIFIASSTWYNITISPSEPRYYFYNFPKNLSNVDGNFKLVILEVASDDDACMTVSIQNASCPIFDLNHDVTFEGYWETVNKKGGITISKSKFPNGFFVVFVAKPDNSDCVGDDKARPTVSKDLRFIIKPSISYNDYVKAVLITVACICMSTIILVATFLLCSRKDFKPRAMEYVDENDSQIVGDVATPSTAIGDEIFDNTSMDETEYDTIAETLYDREVILSKPILYLSDLARKDSRVLNKKSYLYLWQVLTVAVFYGLPVVQLVITYQNVLNDTGNQDLCYYNFLCAHPLGFLSDFNHLFSNIGYIVFGLLFLCLVQRREKLHNDVVFERHFGIPQHYGLFYAMGVALIMEGILSGSYHICPNHLNFQFDSSFMYVMAVLCMIKLYQTRHPDINATAYATFGVLALAIFLGMVGVLEANLYFWVGFTVLHVIICFLLTAQIYYFGYWKLDCGVFKRVYQSFHHDFSSGRSWDALKPVYKGRMVLLVIGNICNWALAALGIYNNDRDFATYLLAVFMANTMLYFVFYIVMKLLHKERINLQTLMYLLLALTCACSAMYFFYHKQISWALLPAQSRKYNRECALLQFYDFHDIWHFLSATGMFFTFMVLLTLDDDLSHKLRTRISVF